MEVASRNNVEIVNSPYVKDGLVFWIDADWNVGIGKHEDNVIPYDLTGHSLYESGSCQFGKNFIEVKMGQQPLVYRCDDIMRMFPTNDTGIGTLEVVFEGKGAYGNQIFYGDVGLGVSNGENGFAYVATQSDVYQAHKWTIGIRRCKTQKLIVFQVKPYSVSVTFKDNTVDSICANGKFDDLVSVGYGTNSPVMPYVSIGFKVQSLTDRKFFCIRMYDRKLTEEETIANFNVDKERFGV